MEAARGTRRSSTRDHMCVVAEALREARAAKVARAAMRAVLVGVVAMTVAWVLELKTRSIRCVRWPCCQASVQ